MYLALDERNPKHVVYYSGMKRLKQLVFVLLGVLVLAVLYYAVSPLFRNVTVSEGAASAVVGTTGHPASGTVRIVTADGKRYVRYEDFKTINGPDIYVYLAKDLEAKEFINLGRVRATEGNINYEIPDEVDVKEYPYVLTWCQTFGVLFNSAKVQ